MSWASIAVLSAAAFGLVSIFDSHFLSRRLPGLKSFLLPVGLVFVVISSLGLVIFPISTTSGVTPVLAALVAGALRTLSIIITLFNYKKVEVSRVIPITFTYPVLVAIIAVPVLGEKLGYLQWLAIIIVVAGAILVSTERDHTSNSGSLSRPFLLLFLASLFLAGADLLTKYSVNYISTTNVYCLSIFVMAVFFLSISARRATFLQIREANLKAKTWTFLVGNELLALSAAVLQFWAIGEGPISLVSTISGTRPVFVAVYSIILSLFVPGFLLKPLTKSVLPLRLLAIVMIVGGISIIYLT